MKLIKAEDNKVLWEILVPTVIKTDNKDHWPVSTKYHRVWDSKVLEITGSDGLTRPPASAGQWENPNGKLFKERMLPVRFISTEEDALTVMEFTKRYYNQEKVMCYVLSDNVYIY